jgi:CHAT domain-containing protein
VKKRKENSRMNANNNIGSKLRNFEEKVKRLSELEKELNSLDTKGFESEVSSIKSKLKSPSKKEGTREKHIFKLEIESPDTIEIASDKVDQGVYSVRFITPHYSSRPKSADVGKDLLEYINASIDNVTEAMNKVRGVRGNEEKKIEDYSREMLGSLRDLGCILYKQILPPDIIGELSEHQQIKHLQLSISEDLGEYPWEAMHDDADIDSFLCLNYALGRSIQVEGTLESPTGIIGDKLKALVIGDPLEGCERELPMAKKEAEEVAKKLRERGVEVKTLIGESATLPKVLPELGRGYDIIHYAGHAEFDTEKPRDSYLILRDEMHLKAKNITKQFEGKKKPIFAYINACKAGKRAEHEEKVENIEYTNDVSGLASAFLEKGIYYIGSVWPIHDDASADAAIYFYDNFLKGVSIGESLRKAKVGVYEKYKGKRTAWAGLVLYGNPTLTIVSG